MTRERSAGCVVALVVLLLSTRAATQPASDPEPAPHVHVLEPATITTDSGKSRRIPPGHFVDEPRWSLLDVEMRRLQDAETRLTAENASMRKTTSAWRPGWKMLGSALLTGITVGAYGTYRATR